MTHSSSHGDATPLVVRGLTDVRSVREILWPGFGRAEGADAGLDYRQEVDMQRLRREVLDLAPQDRPDVLVVADPVAFHRDGLIMPVEAGDPGPRPTAWIDHDSRWVAIYVQPIVAIYNALYRRPPRSWLELTDPSWRGRLVFEAPVRMLTTGPALAELQSGLGEMAWAAWLHGLAANEVHQVADNERAVLEVATGARHAGFSNWNVARRVRPGSPVRHVFLDPTPCVPAFAVAVAGGRSPVLGHRFVRWLASPAGQTAYGQSGRIPAIEIDVPGSAGAGVIPPSVRLAAGTADWISDPDRWVARFAAIFPAEAVPPAGKLRA